MTDLSKPFDPLAALDAENFTTQGAGSPQLSPQPVEVELPSGAPFQVFNEEEASFVAAKVEEYRSQYALSNVSDLSEVDRCVIFETLTHRYGSWLIRRTDYAGEPIDENQVNQRFRDHSAETRQIKKTLGIDKVARDRARGEGSVHEFIQNLLVRAGRFAALRNEQSAKAIELAMQLISLMTLRGNCHDEAEKRKLACTDEDIFDWIEHVFTPEFSAIDEHFRTHEQTFWVRDN